MAQPEIAGSLRSRRAWAPAQIRDRLVRAVAGAAGDLRTKLLVAFLVIAALLILVGVLGLRVLGQSNSRVERLGMLQQRASTYQTLQTQANQLRQLLALRSGGEPGFATLTGTKSSLPGGRSWVLGDKMIAFALSELSPSTNEATYGFVPPAQDERVLKRIRYDFGAFVRALNAVSMLDAKGVTGEKSRPFLRAAISADNDLEQRASVLASRTTDETSALIATNRSAYASSRDLFIAVAAISVVLALGLGFLLSWAVIEPIQRINARLAAIAHGDFSDHVNVADRDELGDLAANVNRMNDELRQLYERLETESRHKSEFLSNMSHELRTPLNAIIGFSQVLRQRLFDDISEKQEEYLDDILSSGEHLLSLINDVLDLSKVEAGQLDLVVVPFSLPDALERGVLMVRERAVENGVGLAVRIGPDVVDPVQGDERRILQVIFNLLWNAVKFTPSGGRVDVESSRADGVICVAIRDTGPGIAPEDQQRVFEKFQQTEVGQKQQEGTGLGLALSKRLIELHGGRLWVESTLGEGSTFRFTLPAVEEPESDG